MLKFLVVISCFLFRFVTFAQEVDVLHYQFHIEVTDESDMINGVAVVEFLLLKPLQEFSLDLVQGKDKGMTVSNVTGDNVINFRQQNNKLVIGLKNGDVNKKQKVTIIYSGIPANGLIISKNKYGDRTFFSDNWPNRAHFWIPCNDRPDDKADFEFIVTAPNHYRVISNGVKVEEKDIDNQKRITHWKEKVSLSTKVMVIGVARFAVKEFSDSPGNIPVSAWVYPQDSSRGFYDYGVTPEIIKYFSDYIAPFPYNKLANVQSKTIFGGMENATAIFYSEESVTGNRKWEDVFAHEIVHQWFGDMASETSFAHLWLSEGFATYLTDIYIRSKYGADSAMKRLEKERADIISFSKINHHAVVDSTNDLMSLLNTNSYQKGSWILHMLNEQMGNTVFQKIIQAYYLNYKGRNASTRDFEAIAEKVSGKNLKSFFDQWLFRPGIPVLNISWKYNSVSAGNNITLNIDQLNSDLYQLPLEILFVYADGTKEIKVFSVENKVQSIIVPAGKKPVQLIIDPGVKLLYTGNISEIKE